MMGGGCIKIIRQPEAARFLGRARLYGCCERNNVGFLVFLSGSAPMLLRLNVRRF